MKSENTKQSQSAVLRGVWVYLRRYSLALGTSLVLAGASAILMLYIPRLIGRAVDMIAGPGEVDFSGLSGVMFRMSGCALAAALCQLGSTLINGRAAYRVSRDLRGDAFSRLGVLPLSYIDGRPYGDVVSRIIADSDQFADGLLMALSQFFTGAVTILGVLVFMLTTNAGIALAAVALTPLSLAVAWFISKRSFSLFRSQTSLRGELTGFTDEMTRGRRVVKAFAREEATADQFDALDGELARASLHATFISSLTNPATRFVNSMVYMSVGVIGALSVLSGGTTVGNLVVFLSYAEQYTKPFNEISGVVTEFQNALACAARLLELIGEEAEVADSENARRPERSEGRVEFEDLTFSYDPTARLIENFSLSVNPGERIAIVGPTGCGKTTLTNLLMRFYEPNSGRILIDGQDSGEIARGSLRALFGMVLQDPWLKKGTIRENILMGLEDYPEEEFEEVLRACRLDALIRSLAEGADTEISENGSEFSQGQRQLICAARVMVRRPQILILDEATSSIDPRAEMQIQAAFNALMSGRTSFIVAHRLSTIRNADLILAMKDGRIVETGNHDELIAKRGFYYDLYASQFKR